MNPEPDPDPNMNMRTCNICANIKPLSAFRKYMKEEQNSQTCKGCLNEQDKQRKICARKKHKETTFVVCELCNQSRALHFFAKLKKFYKKKICTYCYPHFLKMNKLEWCKKEHNGNMNYRIKKSLAARLRTVLQKNKDTHTMDYIGCNIQYLRSWFAFHFTDAMNWEKYGSYWSIDHVIPVSCFDLTNETEKKICWNWSNLVPVPVSYNSSKKKRIIMDQVEQVLEKLEVYKEEGSTTKWFSREFLLNREYALMKFEKQEQEREK